MNYIWESAGWPNFTYDETVVKASLEKLYREKLMTDSAFSIVDEDTKRNLQVKAVSEDIIASLSIEGETIDVESVYSSVSRHLDVMYRGQSKSNEYALSVFSIVADALENPSPMSHERLFDWQRRLFVHKAGPKPKHLGGYRQSPEYVIRSRGKDYDVVYEAVPALRVPVEMDGLMAFVNGDNVQDPFLKAALASIWFVIIHPFEDGNGRISRCLADYIIEKGTAGGFRTFSISSSILQKRNEYYSEIQKVSSSGSLDATEWVEWFLETISESIRDSRLLLKKTLSVSFFMKRLDPSEYNSRELSMLYRFADGSFFGKLTNEKWAKLTKCSNTVAFRDMQHLVEKGLLVPSGEGGRSSGYFFNESALGDR